MYRHLMKAKKLYVYVVVFVAFVNACFFMPMQVQAANVGGAEFICTIDNLGDYPPYFDISTSPPGIETIELTKTPWVPSTDTLHSFTLNFNGTGIGDSSFSNGNHFIYYCQVLFWNRSTSSGSQYLDVTYYPQSLDVIDPAPNFDITLTTGSTSRLTDDGYYGTYINFWLAGDYNYISGITFEFDIALKYWGYPVPPNLTALNFRINTQSLTVYDDSEVYNDVLHDIEQNTQATTDAVNNGFNQAMNGYNDSAGNQVASDFGNSASGYEQAEDNLFQGSESSLSGFQFFDFSGYTGITTGLSFVSSMLVSIYNNFGGMSGIGIVISVLFSVMFLAIVIGLYRYFK